MKAAIAALSSGIPGLVERGRRLRRPGERRAYPSVVHRQGYRSGPGAKNRNTNRDEFVGDCPPQRGNELVSIKTELPFSISAELDTYFSCALLELLTMQRVQRSSLKHVMPSKATTLS